MPERQPITLDIFIRDALEKKTRKHSPTERKIPLREALGQNFDIFANLVMEIAAYRHAASSVQQTLGNQPILDAKQRAKEAGLSERDCASAVTMVQKLYEGWLAQNMDEVDQGYIRGGTNPRRWMEEDGERH